MNDPTPTFDPLITEKALRERLGELARTIADDYAGTTVSIIGLLTGSFIFMADLVRILHQHGLTMSVDFLVASSYRGQTEPVQEVKLLTDLSIPIEGRPVLLVDDILDTGRTLRKVVRHLEGFNPESVRTCVLLDKPEGREEVFEADYVGFTIPDVFVVGYGLDYEGRMRECPWIASVRP